MKSVDVLASRIMLLLCSAMIVATTSSALASTLYVANNGTDSLTCGTKVDPCRSITKGIANSSPGGSIVVGPGSYGDLDNDGTLGGVGEEPDATCNYSDCMIRVTKLVTITSQDGAFATVIHPGTSGVNVVVELDASGAVFGGVGKGFTVETPSSAEAGILSVDPTSDTSIIGNVVAVFGGGGGIGVTGDRNQILGNRAVIEGYAVGFIAAGNANILSGNVSSGGEDGFGFYLLGSNHVLTGNIANGGAVGIAIDGTGMLVNKSSFMGNSMNGILAINPPATTTSATFTECNIVGNAADPAFSNCGLDASGLAVTVKNSWWGAATGPGSDPADDACNQAAGSTTPFATAPIKVKVKSIR
jgi:hypothetical protein